jgi:hypothetical protein
VGRTVAPGLGGGPHMTLPLLSHGRLANAVDALRKDLIDADGPRISTMRNYRFAILQYDPRQEFELRRRVHDLTTELIRSGWVVLGLSLQRMLLQRVRALGEDTVARIVARERRYHGRDPGRALNDLRKHIAPHVEGVQGIAADVCAAIGTFADTHPDQTDRSIVFIGRAGALYPFFRTSALLKHIDGKTRHIPVVLLYPGERASGNALSFMGQVDPDSDYRPRIYS